MRIILIRLYVDSMSYQTKAIPLLRWAGEWVESVDAKHAGAGLGDAIIKIYFDKHKCD